MNKSKLKNVTKKVILWLMIMTSVLVGVPVFAEVNVSNKSLSMRNAKSLIDEAAQAQVIADVMRKCLTSIPGNSGSNIYDSSKETIFNGVWGDEVNVASGRWLEDVINSDDRNGVIECWEGNDKILSLFANLLKLDKNQVLCNKDNTGYAGLIAKATQAGQGGHGSKLLNYDCAATPYSGNIFAYNSGAAENTVYGQVYHNGEEYIKILYQHWWEENISRNPYLIGWSKLDDFSYANSYYTLYNDFGAQCGGFNRQPNNSGSNIVTIKEISDDGSEESVFYQYNKNATASSVTGRERSCTDLVGAINDYYGSYKEALEVAFRNECNKAVEPAWKFVYDQAVVILSDAKQPTTITATINGEEKTWTNTIIDADGIEQVREFTEEDKNNARSTKELYESMAAGRYRRESIFADTSNTPWTCKAPSGYEIAGEAYIDPDSSTVNPVNVPPSCANSGGAASLGWIVCPILEWMGSAADKVYSEYVEPSLQVKPQLFSDNKDEGTMFGWGVFQGIANVLFVILFMVVIFSQLTGHGIDNYGIKKILPKLIVVAILVNISYYICLACVDLSNILGNGFQALFNGLPVNSTPTLNIPDSNVSGSAVGATALTGVAVLGILVTMVGVVWQNPAILLSLLVSALGVVIAILFLFVLLAAREAAIVVLVVISPIAFVCYALPNTKKLFDKWLKFGEGLLLVYPIAGLLVSGGDYVSRLLLSSGFAGGGFIAAFTAMIVGVLPIFFIPTVLKGAFAAMGSIGARISGFGDRVRGGTTKAIRGSEAFKRRQLRMNAGINKRGELSRMGKFRARVNNSKFGKATGLNRRQAAYIAAAKKDVTAGEEASATLTNSLSKDAIASEKYKGNAEKYYEDQFNEAAMKGDTSGMNAALSAAVSSGYLKDKDIAGIVRRAASGGTMKFKNNAARAAWLRDTATKYGGGFLSTDFEMRDWMQKAGSVTNSTGVATAANLGNYGEWAKNNIGVDDIKPEDIPRLSGDSIAGLAQSGVLTPAMAQQVMAKNPNISADKRIMLGAIASGVVSSITDATAFKEEAKALMEHPDGSTRKTNMINATKKQIASWTAPTPIAANVVQDFSSGYSGQVKPVNVAIEGESFEVRRTSPTGAAGSSNSGRTPSWDDYDVTPALREELEAEGLAPGDQELNMHLKRR